MKVATYIGGVNADRTTIDYSRQNELIIAALDVAAEYRALGLELFDAAPNAAGWTKCFAMEHREHGKEANPSAGIHIKSARYKDFGGSGENLSLFDFAAKYHPQRFKDWRDARQYFAQK